MTRDCDNTHVLSTRWMRFTGTVCLWSIEISCQRLLLHLFRWDLWVEAIGLKWLQADGQRTIKKHPKKVRKSSVKYSRTTQTYNKLRAKQNKVNQNQNTTYRSWCMQRKNTGFYSLCFPESFTTELHLGLKAQICNQIAFKKCGGRAQKSNVKCTKVHFSHEPRK